MGKEEEIEAEEYILLGKKVEEEDARGFDVVMEKSGMISSEEKQFDEALPIYKSLTLLAKAAAGAPWQQPDLPDVMAHTPPVAAVLSSSPTDSEMTSP